jgi:lipopolysaccharide/colanic/teichoic acid biosynthesis glycosyltransferase
MASIENVVASRLVRRSDARRANSDSCDLLNEESFTNLLSIERRRAERSRRQFILMLLDAHQETQSADLDKLLLRAGSAAAECIRATDAKGWYQNHQTIGVVFTEIGPTDSDIDDALSAVQARIGAALRKELTQRQANSIHLSFHVFPEKWNSDGHDSIADLKLYPDLRRVHGFRRLSRVTKRAMDVTGSLLAILVLSPLFALIGLAVKLTSKGPMIFRQKRVGQYGESFTFLKFRSMYSGNDPKLHQDYVRDFIAAKAKSTAQGQPGTLVYKLQDDPRITPLGKFLRKTSLDEIPQFFNVLQGYMSLVGPRPPIPYEFSSYDRWHRSRLLETKPGITGLWQVNGRSRTTFDEMVRLDLRYARAWSLWLDIKILFKTPRAVLWGEGAY